MHDTGLNIATVCTEITHKKCMDTALTPHEPLKLCLKINWSGSTVHKIGPGIWNALYCTVLLLSFYVEDMIPEVGTTELSWTDSFLSNTLFWPY